MTVTAEKTTTPRRARRRPSRRRIIVLVAVVVVLLLVVAFIWIRAASAPTQRPRYATAETGSVSRTVDATGTIAAAQEADLSFQVGGQVTAIPVTVGQQVSTGQVLATIDSASLPSQVAQARATLAQNRAKRDADDNASSEQRAADDAAVNAAQAQLDSAQKQLDKATLTSTIDGTVAAVNIDVGQQVAAGSGGSAASAASGASGGAGSAAAGAAGAASGGGSGSTATSAATAQIVVVSTDTFVVNASVDDTQVGQLKQGQAVDITPNGATSPVKGTVTTVGMVATQTSGVASYPVTVDVATGTTGLHIGASAQLSVIVEKVDGVLTVPTAAIRQQGGGSVVDEVRDGQPVEVPVTVGVSGGGRSEISSGLSAGAQVVLPGENAGATGTRPTGGFFGGGGGGGGGGGNGGGQNRGGQEGGAPRGNGG
jgi:membrane fusion protein, macrolide-specific efflux system